MKPLRIAALTVALIGLSAWDTALPVVLPAVAGIFLALGEGLSRRARRQQRIRQVLERQYAAAPAAPMPMPLELAMDETALTLVRLAAPAPVRPASVWDVAPAAEEAPAGAEIIRLDHYRARHAASLAEGAATSDVPPVSEAPPVPAAAPINADRPPPREAAAMQRRLSERVDALRSRSIALRQPAALLAETTADETPSP